MNLEAYAQCFLTMYRFGTEYGMMKAGKDTGGWWHIIDTGVMCVLSFFDTMYFVADGRRSYFI